MAKKLSNPNVQKPGSMLEQKTFEDFNKKEPALHDPNESKGKLNPHSPNLADQAKETLADEIKEKMKPVPSAPRKRIRRTN